MYKLICLVSLIGLPLEASFAQCAQVIRYAERQGDRMVIKSTSVGYDWVEPIQYKQVIEKGGTQFYVRLYALGGSFMDQKGVTVFFNDGTVLEWPGAKVKAGPRGAFNVSQCLFKLTENEIEQFQEKRITSIRLSTQDRSLTLAQSRRAQDIINCVIYAEYCDIKSDKLVNQQ